VSDAQKNQDRLERLERLVEGLLDRMDAHTLQRPIPPGTVHNTYNTFNVNVLVVTEELKMAKYEVGESSGIVGDNANNNTLTTIKAAPQQIDPTELEAALKQLYENLSTKADPKNREHAKGMGKVAEAEEEASKGNTSGAIELLKSAGGWVLEIVKSAASGLLKDLVKDQLTGGSASGIAI
jgi:hypothetical protein